MSRLPPHGELNAITRAAQRLRNAGTPLLDLSESNPTRVGLPYPVDLLQSMAAPAALTYQPHPLGLRSAREAVAGEFIRRGADVDPDHLVLSASTSEAYSWLFKLLCDPGDAVLIPQPSYPLFEYLVRLEGAVPVAYRLTFDGVWSIDFASIEQALREAQRRGARARAIVLASPNNPTGSFVK